MDDAISNEQGRWAVERLEKRGEGCLPGELHKQDSVQKTGTLFEKSFFDRHESSTLLTGF